MVSWLSLYGYGLNGNLHKVKSFPSIAHLPSPVIFEFKLALFQVGSGSMRLAAGMSQVHPSCYSKHRASGSFDF